ncbi:hypothetical protein KY306_01475 [Candidatus Woesearchaeota archaeon]|nr:hypothetical protein [Candidatus Woesearchaeota archaeon]
MGKGVKDTSYDLETLSLEEARSICSKKAMGRELKLIPFIEQHPELHVPDPKHQSDFFPGPEQYLVGMAQIYQQAANLNGSVDLESLVYQAQQPDDFHTFVEKNPRFQELLPIYEEDKKRALIFGLAHQQNQEALEQAEQYVGQIKGLKTTLAQANKRDFYHSLRTAAITAAIIVTALCIGTFLAVKYWLFPEIKTTVKDEAQQYRQPLTEADAQTIFDAVEKRYPLLKGFQKPEEKKQEPDKKPKDKEEDF